MKQETKTNWTVVLFVFQIILIITFLVSYKIIDKKNTLLYKKTDIAGVIGGFTAMHDTQFTENDYMTEYHCKDCGEWIIIDNETYTLSESDNAFHGCNKSRRESSEVLDRMYEFHSLRRTRNAQGVVTFFCKDCGLEMEEVVFNKVYNFNKPFEEICKCKD